MVIIISKIIIAIIIIFLYNLPPLSSSPHHNKSQQMTETRSPRSGTHDHNYQHNLHRRYRHFFSVITSSFFILASLQQDTNKAFD